MIVAKEEFMALEGYFDAPFEKNRPLLQELFPNIPRWIVSGAIDVKSDGFCICPACCGGGVA